MTRKEQICDVTMEQFTYVKDENLKSALRFAFIDGVEWADKHPNLESILHDAIEEPKHGSKVLICFLDVYGKMICDFYHYINYNVLSWKEAVDSFNINQWAYVDDLLPKTK